MWTPVELDHRLEVLLEEQYHHRHPFNVRMHAGTLSREDLQHWVANRYYYQECIPVKDCLLMSKLPARYRRAWISRVLYHDGGHPGEGGLEAWLRLGEAVGLERRDLEEHRLLLPGVKFATDAYVSFVRERDWFDGVASSLTEIYAHRIMRVRTDAFERHYPWVEPGGLAYFRSRSTQASVEAESALTILNESTSSHEDQLRIVEAVRFKCSVLWGLLDALEVRRAAVPSV